MNPADADDADFALSCLLDDVPAIWASFTPWLATAIEIARVAPARIHVHHVCPLPRDVAELCGAHGVATHDVEPLDARFPHANKIRQCFTDFGKVRRVILTDVDVVFARPLPLERIHAPVAGKLVDLANPTVDVLDKIFRTAGLPAPAPVETCCHRPDGGKVPFQTFPGNFNGGLYIIERTCLQPLGRAWQRRALWLFENAELLEGWRANADQISFCLVVNGLGFAQQQLDDSWNLPTHIPLTDGDLPILLHHHAALDGHGCLAVSDHPRIREAVAQINRVVSGFRG